MRNVPLHDVHQLPGSPRSDGVLCEWTAEVDVLYCILYGIVKLDVLY